MPFNTNRLKQHCSTRCNIMHWQGLPAGQKRDVTRYHRALAPSWTTGLQLPIKRERAILLLLIKIKLL